MLSQDDLQTLKELAPAIKIPAEEEKETEIVDLKQAEVILFFKATRVSTDPPELIIRRGEIVHNIPLLKDCDNRVFIRLRSGVWYGNKVFDVFLT